MRQGAPQPTPHIESTAGLYVGAASNGRTRKEVIGTGGGAWATSPRCVGLDQTAIPTNTRLAGPAAVIVGVSCGAVSVSSRREQLRKSTLIQFIEDLWKHAANKLCPRGDLNPHAR